MHSVESPRDLNHDRPVQRALPLASRIRVVSLLDRSHYKQVEDLWAELAEEFAVKGVYVSPRPHITYHIATCYSVRSLEPVLRRLAASKTAFKVRTGGLGIFTGPQPVLYIPVVRSPELTQFHEALWQGICQTGSEVEDYYHPARWVPHITVGIGDLQKDNLSQIVRFLAERDFNWEITLDHVTLVHNFLVPHFGFVLRHLAPKVFGTRFSHFALEQAGAGSVVDGQATPAQAHPVGYEGNGLHLQAKRTL
jgi:2'-5' RNA ligase